MTKFLLRYYDEIIIFNFCFVNLDELNIIINKIYGTKNQYKIIKNTWNQICTTYTQHKSD